MELVIANNAPVVIEKNETKEQLMTPKMWAVILQNDNSTGPDFVMEVLSDVFGVNTQDAKRIMMKAHTTGKCLVTVVTKEVAETKIHRASQMAAQAERGYDFGSHVDSCELTFIAEEQ